MSEPTIASRCPSCGVSVRDLALFCPQCGRPLENGGDMHASEFSPAPEVAEPTVSVNSSERANALPAEGNTPPLQTPTARAKANTYSTQSKGRRVADNAKRGFERDVGQRVDRLRKISSVVIDEAAYDPSLRFLVVAGVLFFVFVVILILSKVIG